MNMNEGAPNAYDESLSFSLGAASVQPRFPKSMGMGNIVSCESSPLL
jgi:hypothetical protein